MDQGRGDCASERLIGGYRRGTEAKRPLARHSAAVRAEAIRRLVEVGLKAKGSKL
jgi:hypothetical protein